MTNNDEVMMESETSSSEESNVVVSSHTERTKDDKGGESLDEGEENVDSEGMRPAMSTGSHGKMMKIRRRKRESKTWGARQQLILIPQ